MKNAAGEPVTYTQAATGSSVSVTPWVGQTTFRSRLEKEVRIEIGERDYLLAVADLVINGAPVRPALGDRIAETINGVPCVFEIETPEGGEEAVRYSSQARDLYRIHTKRVS
jgi:hypothetical protein